MKTILKKNQVSRFILEDTKVVKIIEGDFLQDLEIVNFTKS